MVTRVGFGKYTQLFGTPPTAQLPKNLRSIRPYKRCRGGLFSANSSKAATVREFSGFGRVLRTAEPTQTRSSARVGRVRQRYRIMSAFSRTPKGSRSVARRTSLELESELANGLRGIKGFVFDKDGTLTDFYNTWMPLMREASRLVSSGDAQTSLHLLETSGYISETGKCIPGSAIVAAPTDELAACWWGALPAHLHARFATIEEVTAIVDDVFLTGLPSTTTLVCDLPQFLGCLKNLDLKLGVATNDSESGAFATFDKAGATPYLDFVSGYDSGHGAKPGMIRAFCAQTGLKPCEVAMVGDSLQDLQAGRKAGVGLLVGVLTGVAERDDLAPHANVVLESVVNIQELLAPLTTASKSPTADGDPSMLLAPSYTVEYDSRYLSKREGVEAQ